MEKLKSPEQIKPIKKLYIAQRGEIALRAAKTCLKRGIPAVVPYTFSDANSLATEIAELHLEDGWELSAIGGTSADENYMDPQALLNEIELHECDAVFLGYGFLSESAAFVKQCEERGIRVLSPPSSAMELTGNKIRAREIAKHIRIGSISTIPVLEGTGNLENYEQAFKAAEKIGYPVVLKDPDTGGGSGIRFARDEKELEKGYKELRETSGNKEVFMERKIENALHVEVQVVADKYGNVVSLGERDCTMQIKGQKVIEESPSPHISEHQRAILQTASVNYIKDKRVNYWGVATVEHIIDLDKYGRDGDHEWNFMEVNPRIQVEHPVTEEQTGLDIVDLMIDIAEGRMLPLTQKDIKPVGHTIEARVYAKNPDRDFKDDDGLVSVLRYPKVDGVRIEPALKEGDELSFEFDRTLFKAIAHAETRELAREKLIKVLSGSEVIGVSSNLHFLTELLNTEEFREGKGTTTFVENWWKDRMKEKVLSIAEFINGGTFIEYSASKEFDPKTFPKTSLVIRMKDGSEISYQDHIERLFREKGITSAAKYGIQERDGVRWVSYILDYDINHGVFGPQEGNVLVDTCKLANEEGLDLVTLVSTAGVDQWTNTLGLHQMTRSIAALKKRYPPKSHINVYHGPVYGGVPASFAGGADWQIIVDSEDTRLGFSGPYILARNAGVTIPDNSKAAEVYTLLAKHNEKFQTLHSATKHYQDRNVDFMARSLEEASSKVAHLVHTIAKEESITESSRVYEPKEEIAPKESSSEAARLDRPGFFPVWLSPVSKIRERMIKKTNSKAKDRDPFSNFERWKMIHDLNRPTAADLLDTRMGLFDDTVLLSGPAFHFEGEDEHYPSIIAAVTRIEDIRMLVIAQQTGRVKDEVTNKMIKKYNAQKPEDWEFVNRMILGMGLKNKLPILTLVDTEGADPSPEAESRGQSTKIQSTTDLRNQYPYTSLAFLLGLKGSGGGEALFSPADEAAMSENGLAFVSDPRTKSWIQGGQWFSDDKTKEFEEFINGEDTARAEVMKSMKLIDYIVAEGPQGAHRSPKLFASNIRQWLLPALRKDMPLSLKDRENQRWERLEAPSELFNIVS